MIALLSYSTNLSASNQTDSTIPSTGEVVGNTDSVLISYDDLRLANSKLIELNYEKQINTNLRAIVANDSIIINDYRNITEKLNKDYKKAIKHRNIAISAGITFFITSIFLLIK